MAIRILLVIVCAIHSFARAETLSSGGEPSNEIIKADFVPVYPESDRCLSMVKTITSSLRKDLGHDVMFKLELQPDMSLRDEEISKELSGLQGYYRGLAQGKYRATGLPQQTKGEILSTLCACSEVEGFTARQVEEIRSALMRGNNGIKHFSTADLMCISVGV